MHTVHVWQEYLDLTEQIRKTDRAKGIYAHRKETIERVFADAKEKHAMRYTHLWTHFGFCVFSIRLFLFCRRTTMFA